MSKLKLNKSISGKLENGQEYSVSFKIQGDSLFAIFHAKLKNIWQYQSSNVSGIVNGNYEKAVESVLKATESQYDIILTNTILKVA